MTSLHLHLTPDAAGHRVMTPDDPSGDFGGGCRAGFVGLARAMGRLGTYDVTALSTFRREQTVAGVRYLPIDRARLEPAPDCALAYYDTTPLVGSKARLRIASHHTLIPFLQATRWADVHTAPSDHTRDALRERFWPHGAWYTLPNAVEGLDGVTWRPVSGRVIYHTSPDRGLHHLFGIWPEVRRRVPGATLHVVGDVVGAAKHAAAELRAGARCAHLEALHDGLARGLDAAKAAGGVELLGRLPRTDLLRELSEAACFAFPCDVAAPCETFSVSILECMAVGVPVVLAPADSLGELWGGAAVMAPGMPDGLRDFVDALESVLAEPNLARHISERQRVHAAQFTFDAAARVLDGIIRRHLPVAQEGAAA